MVDVFWALTDIAKAVNDLVTSPISPYILASCSADYTIRIWNLDDQYRRQPCAAILSGEGHRQTILSIVSVLAPNHAQC